MDASMFWGKVAKSDGCWEWQGTIKTDGYGAVVVSRKQYLAHRYAWALTNGPIPDGMFVCHHCDNPRCVRPDHLFLGTALENNRDKMAKGRYGIVGWEWARGENHWSRRLPTHTTAGVKNSHAKLTPEQVLSIRQQHTRRWGARKRLAQQYGVSTSTISHIWSGATWRCVP